MTQKGSRGTNPVYIWPILRNPPKPLSPLEFTGPLAVPWRSGPGRLSCGACSYRPHAEACLMPPLPGGCLAEVTCLRQVKGWDPLPPWPRSSVLDIWANVAMLLICSLCYQGLWVYFLPLGLWSSPPVSSDRCQSFGRSEGAGIPPCKFAACLASFRLCPSVVCGWWGSSSPSSLSTLLLIYKHNLETLFKGMQQCMSDMNQCSDCL